MKSPGEQTLIHIARFLRSGEPPATLVGRPSHQEHVDRFCTAVEAMAGEADPDMARAELILRLDLRRNAGAQAINQGARLLRNLFAVNRYHELLDSYADRPRELHRRGGKRWARLLVCEEFNITESQFRRALTEARKRFAR